MSGSKITFAGSVVASRLRTVTSNFGNGLHEPLFLGNEKRYLNECIESGLVSSTGPFVSLFEGQLADYVGANHAVAVTNGTAALHLALVVAGVKPGDEVLVPALSFVATVSAVVLAGATPHFVDVAPDTWGMDPASLETYLQNSLRREGESFVSKKTGNRVSALLPMHTLGHSYDVDGVNAVGEHYGLAVIEDAAEALGSFSRGVHAGLSGTAGIFSFNGNKTITTGGGGAIVTNDQAFAARARHLSTTAKVPHRFEFNHDSHGFNYRMPNINAALGVAQLEQLPALVERQRSLHALYEDAFAGAGAGTLRSESPGSRSNYWLHALLLTTDMASERDNIINLCLDEGIPVRPLWRPLNSLAPYRASPSAPTPVANQLYRQVICLPSSPGIVV